MNKTQIFSMVGAVLLILGITGTAGYVGCNIAIPTPAIDPTTLQVIVAPDNMPPGEMINIGLSAIKNRPKELTSICEDWQVYDLVNLKERPFFKSADGTIAFSSGVDGNRTYRIQAAVAYHYETKDKNGCVTNQKNEVHLLAKNIHIQPIPGPGPIPDPKPPVPPTPPKPGANLRVLMVYDSATLSKLPPDQLNVFYDSSIRDYLRSKCVVGTDNKTKECRFLDKDSPMENESKFWQDIMKKPRTALPWIVISTDGSSFEGVLPTNSADTMKLLKEYGG